MPVMPKTEWVIFQYKGNNEIEVIGKPQKTRAQAEKLRAKLQAKLQAKLPMRFGKGRKASSNPYGVGKIAI